LRYLHKRYVTQVVQVLLDIWSVSFLRRLLLPEDLDRYLNSPMFFFEVNDKFFNKLLLSFDRDRPKVG
jgi:hypothetical protein